MSDTIAAAESEKIAALMREFVEASRLFAQLDGYGADLEPSQFELRVQWHWGSASPGYEPVRRAVHKEIEAALPSFIEMATKRASDRVESLRAEIKALLG